MDAIRKQDPTFTAFVPRTAAEAVDRYVRCRRNGLKPMLVPECLIECARGLNEEQISLFENWIINPIGELDGTKLVPDTIRGENEKVYLENCKRMEDELPPLPVELNADDEKVELSELTLEEPDNSSSSSPHSTPST